MSVSVLFYILTTYVYFLYEQLLKKEQNKYHNF